MQPDNYTHAAATAAATAAANDANMNRYRTLYTLAEWTEHLDLLIARASRRKARLEAARKELAEAEQDMTAIENTIAAWNKLKP